MRSRWNDQDAARWAAETPQAPALAAAQAELAARLLCDPALASSRQVITLEDGIG